MTVWFMGDLQTQTVRQLDGKAGKHLSQLSYHNFLLILCLPILLNTGWTDCPYDSVEQDNMVLLIEDCTDTRCSNWMVFWGQKILSHLSTQCEEK